jgi:hypothetical protein
MPANVCRKLDAPGTNAAPTSEKCWIYVPYETVFVGYFYYWLKLCLKKAK